MIKNKFFYMLVALTMLIANTAQSQGLKELHIGDQVPDIKLSGFYNDTLKYMNLRDLYKGKLLLLDFWGTWCGPCLEELPKFNYLKKEFGNQIQIVAVGYESYQRIDALFKRNSALNSKDYLVLTKDSTLTRKLFPHKLLPHIVWIDSTGKVTMISEGTDVTSANIKNALLGRPIAARIKQDNMNLSADDIFRPFHLKDTSFLCRSIFTHKVIGMLSFESMQGNDNNEPRKFNRIFMGNLTIRDLYWNAVFNHNVSGQNYSRLIFEVRDSLKYMIPKLAPLSFQKSKYKSYSEWDDDNLYCYELEMPFKVADTILCKYMIADLNRYLNLNGRYEAKEMNCYILKNEKYQYPQEVIKKKYSIKTISNKSKAEKLQKINAGQLTELLNKHIAEGLIVNESGMAGDNLFDFDVNIKNGITSDYINSLIQKFGLTLVQGKRKVSVFVVSERN